VKAPFKEDDTREVKMMLRFMGLALALIATLASRQSIAQQSDDFYRGKKLTLYIGSSAGGGTDIYGRLVARFLGDHLPGHPQVIVANVPGANGLVSANQLAKTLPKDGLAIGTFDRAVAMHAIWNNPAAKFVA
jgi:tripartite-type tricarboxylate transporter receptor subunit TctC